MGVVKIVKETIGKWKLGRILIIRKVILTNLHFFLVNLIVVNFGTDLRESSIITIISFIKLIAIFCHTCF